MTAFRTEPARAWSVVLGWAAVFFVIARAGYRVDAWLQDIEDGRKGWL
jgi:hypothetical protein